MFIIICKLQNRLCTVLQHNSEQRGSGNKIKIAIYLAKLLLEKENYIQYLHSWFRISDGDRKTTVSMSIVITLNKNKLYVKVMVLNCCVALLYNYTGSKLATRSVF